MAQPCPVSLAAAPKPASLTTCLMAAGLLVAFMLESVSWPTLLKSCTHNMLRSDMMLLESLTH